MRIPAGVTGVTGVLVGSVTDGGTGGSGEAGGAGGPWMGVVVVPPAMLDAPACTRHKCFTPTVLVSAVHRRPCTFWH